MPRRATRRGADGMLARFWGWLTGTGYRPELHYMRGGRQPRA